VLAALRLSNRGQRPPAGEHEGRPVMGLSHHLQATQGSAFKRGGSQASTAPTCPSLSACSSAHKEFPPDRRQTPDPACRIARLSLGSPPYKER
jgi:hypothetical protein